MPMLCPWLISMQRCIHTFCSMNAMLDANAVPIAVPMADINA